MRGAKEAWWQDQGHTSEASADATVKNGFEKFMLKAGRLLRNLAV